MPGESLWTVAAFYQFAEISDPPSMRQALQDFCGPRALKGTILVAPEGLNGTMAGRDDAIAALVAGLHDGSLTGIAFDRMELKYSTARSMPFQRLKIRRKREIVTLGATVDPTRRVGRYIAPKDWNGVITDPDTLVIDVRNGFEVALGTFDGATDPNLKKFSDFRAYTETLAPQKSRRIAMFCTGGIRCEKASAYLLEHGFEDVVHLQGGILRYLEDIPAAESRWNGTCFVFDERVALGQGLVEHG